ncbi:hypothetical protein YB2330_000860 [Saitoella coloradoensis]
MPGIAFEHFAAENATHNTHPATFIGGEVYSTSTYVHEETEFDHATNLAELKEQAKLMQQVLLSTADLPLFAHGPRRLAPIERLPVEILQKILGEVATQPGGIYNSLKDLNACLTVSKVFHAYTLPLLYSHVPISASPVFAKFLHGLQGDPFKGSLVKTLDFSGFTSVGMGRTGRMNKEIQMFTATTLDMCLALTPNLQQLLLSEHVEHDIDFNIIARLLGGDMPYIKALDFCAITSNELVRAMTDFVDVNMLSAAPFFALPRLERLSFHECSTIPSRVFAALLPRLHKLTHLDLTHTQVTSDTLMSISRKARLQHLSLSRCSKLSTEAVAEFLLTHPAARNLVSLNLRASGKVMSEDHLDIILPSLPRTLKSINLGGNTEFGDNHLPLLPSTVEELGIAWSKVTIDGLKENLSPNIHTVDLTGVRNATAFSILNNFLLTPNPMQPRTFHHNIRVFELSDVLISHLDAFASKSVAWRVVQGRGRRGWIVRNDVFDEGRVLKMEAPYCYGFLSRKVSVVKRGAEFPGMDGDDQGAYERGIYRFYAYGK